MTDPICGMTVEPERAAGSHTYNGQTYYFCSGHCLAKSKEDPAAHILGHGQRGLCFVMESRSDTVVNCA